MSAAQSTNFAFVMRQVVRLVENPDEFGTIIARAEYAHGENSYLVRYKNGQGAMVEQWWGESALQQF